MTAEEDFKIERNLRYRSMPGKAQIALILQNPYVGPELPLGAHYTITATLFEHVVEVSDDKLPTEPILMIEMDTYLASQCSNPSANSKGHQEENNDKLSLQTILNWQLRGWSQERKAITEDRRSGNKW